MINESDICTKVTSECQIMTSLTKLTTVFPETNICTKSTGMSNYDKT